MGARTLVVILGIVGAILQIYITYVIAQGVLELEEQAGYADWGGQKMMTAWKVTTVASILQVLLIYIVPAFGLLAALVAFVAFIFYLVYDNAAVNGYGE